MYRLMDEGLWWPLLDGKRLAIVSGHADEVAARLLDDSFVQAHGGQGVDWSIEARVNCPPKSVPKRGHWPRMREELFTAECDLLLCSAGSLSAIFSSEPGRRSRKALDTGSNDSTLAASN